MSSTLRAVVVVAAMIAIVAAADGAGAQTMPKLEPYLEIELQRLEETYTVLERFGKNIWPGWTNYRDPEFRVQFPNLVFLIVGPRTAVPEGYQLLEGRTVHAKPVYINRKDELPITPQPPLGGGGGGGLTIRIRLQPFQMRPDVTPPDTAAARSDQPFEPHYDISEQQILVYVHEFFHGFQAIAIPGRAPQPKPAATQARDRLGDYLVARHLKQRTMASREIAFENETELIEGTASGGSRSATSPSRASTRQCTARACGRWNGWIRPPPTG